MTIYHKGYPETHECLHDIVSKDFSNFHVSTRVCWKTHEGSFQCSLSFTKLLFVIKVFLIKLMISLVEIFFMSVSATIHLVW